jgi:DNA-directed RNA polymerase subunit F
MNYTIIEERILSETEIKENYLDKLGNTDVAKKLMEHINKNIKIKNREEALKDLQNLGLNLREDFLNEIIDASPNTSEQVRAILWQIGPNLTDEQAKKIIATLKKYQ